MLRTLLAIAPLLLGVLAAHAQYLSESGGPKGGGTHNDCDSALTVDLTVTPLGGLIQAFDAVIDSGGYQITGHTWTYYTTEIQQAYGPSVQVGYPFPSGSAVCLTVDAFNPVNSEYCQATTCSFVDILQDPSCLAYQPDFTISSVDGLTIGFEEVDAFAGNYTLIWNFGNGVTSFMPNPVNTFDGPGPHEICLTIIGPPPINCTATVCKWLYMGPADVPCTEVLSPGFLHFQSENIVVVLDTSVVTGQNSTTHWDFGDGNTAEGKVAVHVYDPWWTFFELCVSVDLWGPLVGDTCEASHCVLIQLQVAASVTEQEHSEATFWPNPARDILHWTGTDPGPVEVTITDGLGRMVVRSMATASNGQMQIPVTGLEPGIYTLQYRQNDLVRTGRFVKE